MAQTITPVVHGGRRARWGATLALHVIGASLAAAAFGAALGGAGLVLGAPWQPAGAILVAAVALAYAAREALGLPVPVPELRRQVPEWWRSAMPPGVAAFLYGLGLGVGFVTYLRHGTLVAVSAAAVAIGDPWIGAAVMLPFGLARSMAVVAVWSATTEERLRDVVAVLERLGERATRRVANAAVLLAVAVAAAILDLPGGASFPRALPTALLAITFAWAAVAKAARARAWDDALRAFELPAARAARVAVPVLEASVAGLLLAGATIAGSALSLALLATFSVAIARRRDRRLPCGCFGGRRTRSASWLLTRNATLAGLAAVVLAAGTPVPLPPAPGPGEAMAAALVVGGTILTFIVAGRAAALWRPRAQTTG